MKAWHWIALAGVGYVAWAYRNSIANVFTPAGAPKAVGISSVPLPPTSGVGLGLGTTTPCRSDGLIGCLVTGPAQTYGPGGIFTNPNVR